MIAMRKTEYLEDAEEEGNKPELLPIKGSGRITDSGYKNGLCPEIVESAIYNDELLKIYLSGIVQNVRIEMCKRNMSSRQLANLSGLNPTHLSRIFSGKVNIGLSALIKVSCALQMGVNELLPTDSNKRKTNGERFDDITKELDVASCNYLLGISADYVKVWRKNLKNMKTEK